ncbi:hypothetical protein TNCV_3128251 [Trichonephila clavipes]|nr:hypothetical protein TNCV_3128251 [Trichonephila clavipes]
MNSKFRNLYTKLSPPGTKEAPRGASYASSIRHGVELDLDNKHKTSLKSRRGGIMHPALPSSYVYILQQQGKSQYSLSIDPKVRGSTICRQIVRAGTCVTTSSLLDSSSMIWLYDPIRRKG